MSFALSKAAGVKYVPAGLKDDPHSVEILLRDCLKFGVRSMSSPLGYKYLESYYFLPMMGTL